MSEVRSEANAQANDVVVDPFIRGSDSGVGKVLQSVRKVVAPCSAEPGAGANVVSKLVGAPEPAELTYGRMRQYMGPDASFHIGSHVREAGELVPEHGRQADIQQMIVGSL